MKKYLITAAVLSVALIGCTPTPVDQQTRRTEPLSNVPGLEDCTLYVFESIKVVRCPETAASMYETGGKNKTRHADQLVTKSPSVNATVEKAPADFSLEKIKAECIAQGFANSVSSAAIKDTCGLLGNSK